MFTNKNEGNGGILSRLIGVQLSAVVFVMDYLQLQFDGDLMTVLNPIEVKANGQTYKLGDLYFRDFLCERISHLVEDIFMSDDELRIDFDDSSVFRISLKDEDASGPEVLNFNWREDGEERFMVV